LYFTAFKKGGFTATFSFIKQINQTNNLTAPSPKSFSVIPKNKTKTYMGTFWIRILIAWQPTSTSKGLKGKSKGNSVI
jgi:hypothetical protein